MKENRRHARIAMEGEGYVTLNNQQFSITLVNLSRSGACLSLPASDWAQFEDEENLTGFLSVKGESIPFTARICWSMNLNNESKFGLEFLEYPTAVVDRVFTNLEVLDVPEDSFNI